MAGKFTAPIIGSLVVAAGAALGAHASAATYCPSSESFFGTIERVNANTLTVRTPSGHWALVRINDNARVNANGAAIRPGVFVGAYGCVTPGGVFHASEITLSGTQRGYNERLSGVVRRVESNGRLLVAQNGHGYGTWYVPDTHAFAVGQAVDATGMIGANGAFYPQTINGRSVVYDTPYTSAPRSTITLTGTVRRVSGNAIVVWEPAHGTTGTWIVSNAGRFRVGQRVSARGTEDRSGRFYVQEITIL